MTWNSERSRNGSVDEVPLPQPAGRLFLCGKHFIGPDVEAALARVGATTAVCLNELGELVTRYPDYVDWLRANQPDRAVWFPIPDLHAPQPAAAHAFLDDLLARLGRGETLLLHCGAGIGRAGTLAAAILMRMGTPMTSAVEVVARSRPMAGPEAGAQRDLLEATRLLLSHGWRVSE